MTGSNPARVTICGDRSSVAEPSVVARVRIGSNPIGRPNAWTLGVNWRAPCAEDAAVLVQFQESPPHTPA